MARFELGRGGAGKRRPLRIAYGRVFQESNAFSPLATTRAEFEAGHCLGPAELERVTRLRGRELEGFLRNAELSGFRQATRLAGNVEAVPLWSTFAISGGTSSRAARRHGLIDRRCGGEVTSKSPFRWDSAIRCDRSTDSTVNQVE